jgi:two-component system, NtrC family, sensor kinase
MDPVRIITLAIHLAAIGWSIVLLWRMWEGRLGFLPLLLGLIVARQIMAWPSEEGASATIARDHTMSALSGLVTGIMAFLAVFLIDRVLTAHKQVEALLREHTRLATLAAHMGMVLTGTKPPQDMLGHYAALLVQHLDAALARIWTLNEQENVLELQASAGMYTHLDGPYSRVPVGRLQIGRIAQERQPWLTNAVIGDPRVDDQEWAKRERMVAFAGYPLLAGDRLLGVVAMFARQPLTAATLHALALVNHGIASAIDRKQAEEALQQNEQGLRSIINNTSAAIYVKDVNSRYLLINSQYEKLFNITPEQIRGQSVYDIFPTEVADAFRANDLRVLQMGTAMQCEEVVPQADGLHTYVSVKFPLFDAAGKPYAVGGISTDITERKRMEEALREREERWRAIIDTTPECVKLLDGDGTVLEMNAAGLALIEADSAEAIIGRSVYSLIAPEYRAAFRTFSERICRGDKGHLEFEVVGLRGIRRWMETHAVPLRNQADGTLMQLAITRDITARKRAEEERERLHAQLLQAQKMGAMGILAGDIAHDFNNILASSLGYTELTLDRVPHDSPARWRLQEVLTAGKRAKDLVQQILASVAGANQNASPSSCTVLCRTPCACCGHRCPRPSTSIPTSIRRRALSWLIRRRCIKCS